MSEIVASFFLNLYIIKISGRYKVWLLVLKTVAFSIFIILYSYKCLHLFFKHEKQVI